MNQENIKNFKDFFAWIKKENDAYVAKIKEGGGLGLYLRRFTAQILWLLFFYLVSIWLLPIKDFLVVNAILFVIFGLATLLWNIIKSQLPAWPGSLIKGEFFYHFDGWFLNGWIFSLILVNMFLLLIPIDLYKKFIKNDHK